MMSWEVNDVLNTSRWRYICYLYFPMLFPSYSVIAYVNFSSRMIVQVVEDVELNLPIVVKYKKEIL